jgi:hypothetical protein
MQAARSRVPDGDRFDGTEQDLNLEIDIQQLASIVGSTLSDTELRSLYRRAGSNIVKAISMHFDAKSAKKKKGQASTQDEPSCLPEWVAVGRSYRGEPTGPRRRTTVNANASNAHTGKSTSMLPVCVASGTDSHEMREAQRIRCRTDEKQSLKLNVSTSSLSVDGENLETSKPSRCQKGKSASLQSIGGMKICSKRSKNEVSLHDSELGSSSTSVSKKRRETFVGSEDSSKSAKKNRSTSRNSCQHTKHGDHHVRECILSDNSSQSQPRSTGRKGAAPLDYTHAKKKNNPRKQQKPCKKKGQSVRCNDTDNDNDDEAHEDEDSREKIPRVDVKKMKNMPQLTGSNPNLDVNSEAESHSSSDDDGDDGDTDIKRNPRRAKNATQRRLLWERAEERMVSEAMAASVCALCVCVCVCVLVWLVVFAVVVADALLLLLLLLLLTAVVVVMFCVYFCVSE